MLGDLPQTEMPAHHTFPPRKHQMPVPEERVVSEQPPSVASPESASAWKPRAQSPQGDPSPMTEQHSGPGPGLAAIQRESLLNAPGSKPPAGLAGTVPGRGPTEGSPAPIVPAPPLVRSWAWTLHDSFRTTSVSAPAFWAAARHRTCLRFVLGRSSNNLRECRCLPKRPPLICIRRHLPRPVLHGHPLQLRTSADSLCVLGTLPRGEVGSTPGDVRIRVRSRALSNESP